MLGDVHGMLKSQTSTLGHALTGKSELRKGAGAARMLNAMNHREKSLESLRRENNALTLQVYAATLKAEQSTGSNHGAQMEALRQEIAEAESLLRAKKELIVTTDADTELKRAELAELKKQVEGDDFMQAVRYRTEHSALVHTVGSLEDNVHETKVVIAECKAQLALLDQGVSLPSKQPMKVSTPRSSTRKKKHQDGSDI